MTLTAISLYFEPTHGGYLIVWVMEGECYKWRVSEN